MFEKRKPFLYFLSKVGPLEERFHEIFGKPWLEPYVVFNSFGGKEPVSKSKMFMFSMLLNCNPFPKALFNWKRKRRWYSRPLHERGRLRIPRKISWSIGNLIHTVFCFVYMFEMYMSASRKQDFHISVVDKWLGLFGNLAPAINSCKMYRTTKPALFCLIRRLKPFHLINGLLI